MNEYREHIALTYNGNFDYIFYINKKALQDAIDYKDNLVENGMDYAPDFNIILDYLDKHGVNYDYIDVMNIDTIEY